MTAIPARDRCGRFLDAYLCSVGDELAARGCAMHDSAAYLAGYQEALRAVPRFSAPGAPRTIRAGWYEELGWWAEYRYRLPDPDLAEQLARPVGGVRA